MSTNAQPSPEVKPAITEADVVAFLVAQIRILGEATGEDYASITLDITKHRSRSDEPADVEWKAYTGLGRFTPGKTVAEAIEANARVCKPDAVRNRAEEARRKAKELLAEATALESQAAARDGAAAPVSLDSATVSAAPGDTVRAIESAGKETA